MLRRSIEFTSRKQTLELLFIDTVLDFESRQAVSDGTVTIQASKTQTIYCHGLPGSAREISMLVDSDESNILVMGPNDIERFETVIGSKQIETAHVIGFSLGAMAAIEIAAKYPQLSKKLSLIAPAAPLELGDFLPDMAGAGRSFEPLSKGPLCLGFSLFCKIWASSLRQRNSSIRCLVKVQRLIENCSKIQTFKQT